MYEIIKERNPLYTLSRGTKPGSFIGRISSLASRKKQYQKLSDIYENKISEIINSSADLLITEQNSKQKDLQEAIDANKKTIEKNEIEIEKKKKDKDNLILELMDAKKEFIWVSINPVPIKILLITPSPANKTLNAKDLKSSFIQKGIINDTINNLAEFGLAIFAI